MTKSIYQNLYPALGLALVLWFVFPAFAAQKKPGRNLKPDDKQIAQILREKNAGMRDLSGETVKAASRLSPARSKAIANEPKIPAGSAQDRTGARRVRFPKGASGTIVTGKIVGGKTVSYLVGAKTGQTISVKIVSSSSGGGGAVNNDVFFEVIAPDGNRLGGNERMDETWSRKLRKSGDYVIWVSADEAGNTDFKFQVSIR